MNFTIKNLREVEDSAPKFGFGERQEAHFAAGVYASTSSPSKRTP